jgi:hypothetical protein
LGMNSEFRDLRVEAELEVEGARFPVGTRLAVTRVDGPVARFRVIGGDAREFQCAKAGLIQCTDWLAQEG